MDAKVAGDITKMLARINSRLERMEGKLGGIEGRLEEIEDEMAANVEPVVNSNDKSTNRALSTNYSSPEAQKAIMDKAKEWNIKLPQVEEDDEEEKQIGVSSLQMNSKVLMPPVSFKDIF